MASACALRARAGSCHSIRIAPGVPRQCPWCPGAMILSGICKLHRDACDVPVGIGWLRWHWAAVQTRGLASAPSRCHPTWR